MILPTEGAVLVFGLYYSVVQDAPAIRLSIGIMSVAIVAAASRLPGFNEVLYLALPVGGVAFLFLRAWQSVILLLMTLFSAWTLSETPGQKGVIITGLMMSFGLTLWRNQRLRSRSLQLESRIHTLEGREESRDGTSDLPAVGPSLSDDQFREILQTVTRMDKTVEQLLVLTKEALVCHTVALYRHESTRFQLGQYISDSSAHPRKALSRELATLLRSTSRTIALSITRKEDEDSAIYEVPPEEEVKHVLMTPVLEGRVVTGALIGDCLRSEGFTENDKGVLSSVAGLLSAQQTRNNMVRELGHAAQASAAMVEISHILLSNIQMAELPERLIEACRLVVKAPFLAFFNISRGRFKLRACAGFEPGKRREFSGKGHILGWISRHGTKYHVSDIEARPVNVLPFSLPALKTFLGLPLAFDGRCQGILFAGSEQADAFSARDIHMLETAVLQAATAMANATLHSRLEKMAVTDGLTGLYNHQNFRTLLEKNFERLGRFPESLSLLLLDIDHFKKINDTYGHPAGDAVLRQVAAIIRKTLRKIDIPARYGGEEFAVVLIRAGCQGAVEMAERLRTTIGDYRFHTQAGELQVTVSIGVATFPDDAGTPEALIELADKALYQSKNSGRNRTTMAADIASP